MNAFQGKILFVDDCTDTCEMVEVFLRQANLDATCCSCPVEALNLLKNEKFDIVFTDLVMEGMNGDELCTEISLHRPGTPVILITGFPSFEAAVLAMQVGAHDFLTKPINIHDMILSINEFAHRSVA